MSKKSRDISNGLRLCILFFIFTIFNGCGSGGQGQTSTGGGSEIPGGTNGPQTETVITGIELTPVLVKSAVGVNTKFTAVAKDASGNPIDGINFSWNSSTQSVATIDGSGVASALSAGTTSIQASTVGVKSNQVTLTIVPPVNFMPNQGSSGTRVLITGDGFSQNSTVTIGSNPTETAFVNPNRLITHVPLQYKGNSFSSLQEGPVTLSVDGINIGTFTITALPENPNPPGTLLANTIKDASVSFSSIRQDLETKMDSVFKDVQDPDLLDHLAKIKASLPVLEASLKAPLDLSTIPPDLLTLIERQLYSEIQAEALNTTATGSLSSALNSATVTCATPMDTVLCNRKTMEEPARILQKMSAVCDLTSEALNASQAFADAISTAGAGGPAVILPVYCTEIDIGLALISLLEMPHVDRITLQGSASLNQEQFEIYRAIVTTQCAFSSEDFGNLAFHKALHVAMMDETIRTASDLLGSFIQGDESNPQIPCGLNESGQVSSGNFNWSVTDSDKLEIILPGQVQVHKISEDATANLVARLTDELLTAEEREFAGTHTIPCNQDIQGCLSLTLTGKQIVTLTLEKEGSGTGIVFTFSASDYFCGPDCYAFFVNSGDAERTVTVSATPTQFSWTGASFLAGWRGSCLESASPAWPNTDYCTVIMDKDQTVIAIFGKMPGR